MKKSNREENHFMVVLVESDPSPVIPLEFYKSARGYGQEGREDTTEMSCFQDGGFSSFPFFLPIILLAHLIFSQSPSALALYDTSDELRNYYVGKTVFAVVFMSLR